MCTNVYEGRDPAGIVAAVNNALNDREKNPGFQAPRESMDPGDPKWVLNLCTFRMTDGSLLNRVSEPSMLEVGTLDVEPWFKSCLLISYNLASKGQLE